MKTRTAKRAGLTSLLVAAASLLGAATARAQDAAPEISAGDTAWILASAALVMLMTAPGLALFYGGLVSHRNMLSTLMHSFFLLCLISVQWVMFGYSLSFAPGGLVGGLVGRALPLIEDAGFRTAVIEAVKAYRATVDELEKKTPYGVPYEPRVWGAGWDIQRFGKEQYFLHASFPEVFPKERMLNALNFILGVHPGPNTSSFVSGVGARSVLYGYGFNRADWSYIPGGSASGTGLIRPDYPELLEWPYLWQQTEYVLGGGTTDYLLLVLAADHLLSQP